MILDEIVVHKREVFARRIAGASVDRLIGEAEEQCAHLPPARDFLAGFGGEDVAIIAEVKKASPSAGIIRDDFDPVTVARVYEENGAVAVSVLTDQRYFQGSLDYLGSIRGAVSLPLLRKDFLLEEYELYESRLAGADGVLLIARILEGERLGRLLECAASLGLEALVEVHDEGELDRALELGARLIGINNRDLDTLEVDIDTTLRLMERVPRDRTVTVISESGIANFGQIDRLRGAGVNGFLIGESLLRERDMGRKLRFLRGVGEG